MKNQKVIGFQLLCLLLFPLLVFAQGPNNSKTYYSQADGKKGKSLKTAMYQIINYHTVISYANLFEAYKKTDLRPDGTIWDMYSNTSRFDPDDDRAGTYKKEGDVFNREHSFPKSWFNNASPMNSDLMHVVPTDGYVNNRRSNYPFGETNGETYQSDGGWSKLGACTVSGYSGRVFEPNDEYKGDFARIYFYMATCYEDKIAGWSSDALVGGESYRPFASWYMDMLMRWSQKDPVSQKEIDRNNAVYELQGNRNPFVDYPGLEQYVWGSSTEVAFSYDQYKPVTGGNDNNGNNGNTGNGNNNGAPDTSGAAAPGSTHTYYIITSADGLVDGAAYLLVSPSEAMALAAPMSSGKAYEASAVTVSEGTSVTTKVNADGCPHELILSGSAGHYRLSDAVSRELLGLSKSENGLHSLAYTEGMGDGWTWNITFSDAEAVLQNNSFYSRTVRYNAGSPRFACYTSGQTGVALFVRKMDPAQIVSPALQPEQSADGKVYSMDGRCVGTVSSISTLRPGIYVVNGKKVIVSRK